LRGGRVGHHALHQFDDILQWLQAVIPSLKQDVPRRRRPHQIIQIGRVLTLFLLPGARLVMAMRWEKASDIFGKDFTGSLVLIHPLWWYRIQTMSDSDDGHDAAMWLGEQILRIAAIGNGFRSSYHWHIWRVCRLPAGPGRYVPDAWSDG